MNICVWPAVKISLITPRLESKAAYLASQQAAGLRIQPPGDETQPCCVMLWQGLFVVFVSSLFSVALFTRFQVTPCLRKE